MLLMQSHGQILNTLLKFVLAEDIFFGPVSVSLSDLEDYQTLQFQMKTMILLWTQRLSRCIFVGL